VNLAKPNPHLCSFATSGQNNESGLFYSSLGLQGGYKNTVEKPSQFNAIIICIQQQQSIHVD